MINGVPVVIEYPIGSQRPHKAGKTTMQAHYGYIDGTRGVDGDEVDVYVGPNEFAPYVYIVKQLRPNTGEFDELKLMLGFNSAKEAEEMYLKHYNDARFFGGIVPFDMPTLKRALKDGPKMLKAGFKLLTDIATIARANTNFRTVVFTNDKSQLVVMDIKPNEDIGKETHKYIEQILFLIEGSAIVEIAEEKHKFVAGEVAVIPPDTEHNVINEGDSSLKIVTIYIPPNHIAGRVHKTKADAEADKEDEKFGHRVIK